MKNEKHKYLVGGASATALYMMTTSLVGDEGLVLITETDPVGVPTYCYGETLNAVLGEVHTKAYCEKLLQARAGGFMDHVSSKLRVMHTPRMLYAHAHFSYNIGKRGYSRSTALKLTNAGLLEQGCKAMMNWHTAGGRDCRVRSNNCYGLVVRRQKEVGQCLLGVEELRRWEAEQEDTLDHIAEVSKKVEPVKPSFWQRVIKWVNKLN